MYAPENSRPIIGQHGGSYVCLSLWVARRTMEKFCTEDFCSIFTCVSVSMAFSSHTMEYSGTQWFGIRV